MAGPMRRALANVDEVDISPLLEFLADRYPSARGAAGILRNSLLRAIAARALDAFYADLWANAQGLDKVVFVGSSLWDGTLLRDRPSWLGFCHAVGNWNHSFSPLSVPLPPWNGWR